MTGGTTAHPIVVLWTTPRSRSTAFERMVVERGDHQVFDEPFSLRYYYSCERRSDRFDQTLPDSDLLSILARLRAAAQVGPVFVKDMAYYLDDVLGEELLAGFVNSFLVREPTAAIASFAREWPDLTEEEAGYPSLGKAFRIARSLTGADPPVIEADELAADPSTVIAAWCDAVGVGYRSEALTWEPGMIEQWVRWREWYEGVAQTSGFRPPPPGPARRSATLDDPRLAAVADRAQPVYEELTAVRIGRPPSQ